MRTPESVAFSYELAGLGSRFLAVLLDLLIQLGITVAALVAISLAGSAFEGALRSLHISVRPTQSVVVAIEAFALFSVFFGYFIVLEAMWNGRTPGKRALGIRVVRDEGYPLDFMSSLIRNLVRSVEFGLGFYVISAASALLSQENKRLGDFAAGTIVVRDQAVAAKAVLMRHLLPPSDAQAPWSLAQVSTDQRSLAGRFVARRDALTPERRKVIAAGIAGDIRPFLAAEWAMLEDEALLERLAQT